MSQNAKILELLSDGKPHRTDEIMASVYGGSHLGLARIGARIWELKKKGYEIKGWKDSNPTLYYYQLSGAADKAITPFLTHLPECRPVFKELFDHVSSKKFHWD